LGKSVTDSSPAYILVIENETAIWDVVNLLVRVDDISVGGTVISYNDLKLQPVDGRTFCGKL
jgi:hypothetical protein